MHKIYAYDCYVKNHRQDACVTLSRCGKLVCGLAEGVQDLPLDDGSAAEGRGIAAKGTEKTAFPIYHRKGKGVHSD